MNRNTSLHFSQLPKADIRRSSFDLSHSVKLTANTASIVPFLCQEIYPGDEFQIKTNKVVRLQTPLTPFMDNMYLDTYYFFVPNRLVWKHWQQFMGENNESAWIPETEYSVPQIAAPENGWNVGTIADYLGIPPKVGNIKVSALPFRAYAKICDDWFRDENLSDPLVIPDGDSEVTGVNTGNFVSDVAKGGLPYSAAKMHDFFTSALPSPQKGEAVPLPVAAGEGGVVGVYAGSDVHTNPVHYALHGIGKDVDSGQHDAFASMYYTSDRGISMYPGSSPISSTDDFRAFEPDNLYADLSSFRINVGTISELRQAFAIQRFYEKSARNGSRYIEVLRGMFGVTSPDSRLQRSEYLGGNRIPLHVNQVIQQSGSIEDETPQGTVTAMSLTTDSHFDFDKSFVEHGWLIGVCCVRYDHTYQQGINRAFLRKDMFDFYWPTFANLSERAIQNKEIYAQGSTVVDTAGNIVDDKAFGYQEAWAEMRYNTNRVCGEMRSVATNSLDVWHLGDDYSTLPVLSDTWIREDKSNVDRVLTVTSSVSNQLFADFYLKMRAIRPLPKYSTPGLIDHF